MLFKDIYKNKKILVTGNTGFKGSWLTAWLLELKADVYGISINIPTNPSHFGKAGLGQKINHFEADICDLEQVIKIISEVKPDFVFHLAAQPLVRLSYEQPILTITTNILGSANILEALRKVNSPCNVVMITSDKSYDNVEWVWGYRESDDLGGKDPYSASKAGAEMAIKTYAHAFFRSVSSKVKVAVGRAGNVIGGGDWASDRIIPDCIRAWSQNLCADIRNSSSTRPWQHVLEPLSGYLLLGQKLAEDANLNGEAFNFGPNPNQNHSVEQLILEMKKHWTDSNWKKVSIEDQSHEANMLKLCCDKALHEISWRPVMSFEETVNYTIKWYMHYYQKPNKNIFDFTRNQIESYVELATMRKLAWSI